MKLTAEIISTSQKGYSLLVLRKPDDSKRRPSVQQQVPTDVAVYLKSLIDQDQEDWYDLYE
jgi:hypothetical protein